MEQPSLLVCNNTQGLATPHNQNQMPTFHSLDQNSTAPKHHRILWQIWAFLSLAFYCSWHIIFMLILIADPHKRETKKQQKLFLVQQKVELSVCGTRQYPNCSCFLSIIIYIRSMLSFLGTLIMHAHTSNTEV